MTLLIFLVLALFLYFIFSSAYQRRILDQYKNKRVLITGGSRGLGFVLAQELRDHGARVAICARDGDEMEKAKIKLGADSSLRCIRCDVVNRESVDKMVWQVTERFKGLDMLINNAGIISVGPLEAMTHEDFTKTMDVNFFGALNTTLAVVPMMRKQRSGSIVNIVSIGGKISAPHMLPYNASKFALAGFSEGLRAELAQDKVSVTTVYPGLMRTGSPVNALFKGRFRREYAWFSHCASLPFFSIDARRAARQILAAAMKGRPIVHLTLPAKIGVRLCGLFPGLTVRLLSQIHKMLPDAGRGEPETRRGKDCFSIYSPSRFTAWSDKAALRNNEMEEHEIFKNRGRESKAV